MRWIRLATISVFLILPALSGCAPSSPTPDTVRQQTAEATATAVRDAKAVAQGIVEGLKVRGPLNINRASKSQLEKLPGIDSAAADRILDHRPYKESSELRRKHVLSRAEYNHIANHIEAR